MRDHLPDSPAPPLPDARASRIAFHLCLLLAIAAVTRFGWLCALPAKAISVDLNDWRRVAQGLAMGMDPYARGHLLNWPPFWMEVIYLCMRFSARFGWDFIFCIRCVLIAADLGVLAASFLLLRMLGSGYGLLLLLGYCLNPLLTLLTVQHGNFDAFAELWILLLLIFLLRFRRGRKEIDFLLAAACLGMGGFTKTFPLMLWPLLAPAARQVSAPARWLACGLVVGPIALAIAPLYVVAPEHVFHDVISYRGVGGSFGVLGLLNVIHLEPDAAVYSGIFTCVFLAGLAALAIRLWREDLPGDDDVVLLTAVILLASFVLGPGYGPQYWFWVTPLLLVCYRQYRRLRIVLLVAAVIIVATNIFEYAVLRSLGQFWLAGHPSEGLERYSEKLLFSDPDLARLCLPMTLASLFLLAACAAVLARRMGPARSRRN
ncbi:MAG: hypothetical protein ABSB74_07570 [Tepidisphaeraceae bacterium]